MLLIGAGDTYVSGGAAVREVDTVEDEYLVDNDDIYSDAFREELLDADEIDARGDAFMRGYNTGWL
ncbi:MAG TPA: hypothetical protein VKE88_03170 [Candidatus Nanoarchaeia archaeon]|nr:hypothetical protein [Candidatus Nanoarchaeia archaeon]